MIRRLWFGYGPYVGMFLLLTASLLRFTTLGIGWELALYGVLLTSALSWTFRVTSKGVEVR